MIGKQAALREGLCYWQGSLLQLKMLLGTWGMSASNQKRVIWVAQPGLHPPELILFSWWYCLDIHSVFSDKVSHSLYLLALSEIDVFPSYEQVERCFFFFFICDIPPFFSNLRETGR